MSSSDGLAHLWTAQLAVTLAVTTVLLLRRLCRRWLGAERAFQLWLLPPLALVASQWPHTAGSEFFVLPETVRGMTMLSARHAMSMYAGGVWQAVALLTWAAGVVAILCVSLQAQWAYERQLRGASPYGADMRWRVVRASSPSVGPAMVGAWRPTIVLPEDFEQRYSMEERALVLAHEVAHAERRDGLWALCALSFSALCWPSAAPWALRAFRHDQELACDARVLRRMACRRRSYAQAMLKTPVAAKVLPSGCSWSSRHPLTERIAMLNSNLPSPFARRAGLAAMFAAGAALSGLLYAATAPASNPRTSSFQGVAEYQLDVSVDVSSERDGSRHSRRANLALCMKPGEKGSVSVHEWSLDATVTPDEAGQVRMTLDLKDGGGADLAVSQLRGKLDAAMHEGGAARDGVHQYAIDVTPRAGCPARDHAKAARTG